MDNNGLDTSLLVDTLIKLAIFLPIMGLVGWWLCSAWLVEKTLHIEEFAVGVGLWAIGFGVGVGSIIHGGWSSMTVVALVFVVLLALAVWEYDHWRRVEMKHLYSEVARYRRAIERDPTAVAAYSLLGETHLKLYQFEEAEEALGKAVEMDPEAKRERRLLEKARRREGGPPKWWRTD